METDEAHDRKHNARFSRVALQALREWLTSHSDDPYPSEYEKITLAKVTGLKIAQINLWYANARRRGKHLATTPPSHKLVLPKLCMSEEPTSTHTASLKDSKMKTFQCTFCPDTFKTKYDWTRHETSLHLPLKRYICCPFSPIMEDPATKTKSCAYCGILDPTIYHIKTHNHSYCQDRDLETRTFFRKDHLRKHLQSVHESQLLPHMDAWLLEAVFINSRCGFCGQRFSIWKERNDHIAAHFKKGKNMDEWKGCRGLDAFISAEVKAAMPSFLIGIERSSPNPFSASTMRHEPEATVVSSWEVLAVHLHNLTKKLSEEGQVVSDEMLQTHARLVVFGSSEAQGLTAANSPEWLDLFKKAHGLDIIPDCIGGEAQCIPEDLEVYQDLGLRIPTGLQEQRQGAMVSLFLSNGPPLKDYRRFSSLDIPLDKALRFETIAGPWPAAGVLGKIFVTSKWLLQGALEGQVRRPIAFTGHIGEDHSEDINTAQDLISMARTQSTAVRPTDSLVPREVLCSFEAEKQRV